MRQIREIKCEICDRELALVSSWANRCKCGREYNGFGQLLAPRSQWGCETGESEADFHGMDDGDGYGYYEE